jgi:hypothetical protein
MCHKLITALLAAVAAGVASAQEAGSSGNDTNALRSNPATTQVATSAGSLTNSVLAEGGINEQGTFGLEPMLGEPFVPSRKLWLSEVMAVDGRSGPPVVDPDSIQVHRDILFHNLDLLLRAGTRGSPVYFGIGGDLKLVQLQEHQPGVPVPVGMSYPMPQQRWTLFTEFAPILAADTSTSLGWGGGVGIRFYFGR